MDTGIKFSDTRAAEKGKKMVEKIAKKKLDTVQPRAAWNGKSNNQKIKPETPQAEELRKKNKEKENETSKT